MKTENNIKFATKEIQLAEIEVNEGQIPELPRNPRIIKDERFAALKKSIKENPEMLALREIIVVPHDGKFVAIGGNMRLLAMRELKFKVAPCKVIPEGVPAETLRAYAIKDNIAFGELDWDALANEWNTEELENFGLELDGLTEEIDADEEGDEEDESEEDSQETRALHIVFQSPKEMQEFLEKHRVELNKLRAEVQISEK